MVSLTSAIHPANVPKFKIDFDLPAKDRYDDLFFYFKDTIIEMEHSFYYSIA